MRWLLQLRAYGRSLFQRRTAEAELTDELRFHFDQQVQENLAAGIGPEEARYAAMRILGGSTQIKEECRDMRAWHSVEVLFQDLRYAFRTLRRSPGFAAVAVLSLALGIGANTAIFGLIDHVMLRLLPVRDPQELLTIRSAVSYPRFQEIVRRNEIFASIIGVRTLPDTEVSQSGGQPGRATIELVSGNYFETLGVGAVRGRTIVPADDGASESSPVAVISDGYWKREFGGSNDALGRRIRVRSVRSVGGTGGLDVYDKGTTRSLDGATLTIVGIAPPEFSGDVAGTSIDVWIPMAMQPDVMPGRPFLKQKNAVWVNVMGRMKPGFTQAQAAAAMTVLWRQILMDEEGSQITDQRRREIAQTTPKMESGERGFGPIRRSFSQPLLMLMAVAGLVLLIACLNVANLLLARATARKKEVSVRLSLGAGRGRLIRQLLTESLLLSIIGGAVGIVFAYAGTQILVKLLSEIGVPINVAFEGDWRTLGFMAAVAVATGILFGLAPAFRATRLTLAETLKDAGRASVGARAATSKVLVGAQVAVSMLLLIGSGLFLRTLYNLKTQDVGYNPDGLLIMRLDPVSAGYRGDQVGRAMRHVLERIRATPGVRSATFSENGLFSGSESADHVDVEGYLPASEKDREVRFDQIGPDYFTNIGIPILLGRDISDRDVPGALRTAVINETMAKFYFRGANPVGKHVTVGDVRLEIVGVARDARDHDFRDEPVRRVYVSYLQPIDAITTANFEIRANGNSGAVSSALRQEVRAIDRNLTILSMREERELMDASVVAERLVAKLSSFFGALAAILAAIGLYGVTSYAVARRTSEIGIRIALGAARSTVLGMIFRDVGIVIAAGGTAGIVAAFAITRLIKSFLFGLSPMDPVSLFGAAAMLAAVGALAGYFPARRAARIDPMVALRYE